MAPTVAAMRDGMQHLESTSQGFVRIFGQGLFYGGLFTGNQEERNEALQEFKKICRIAGVWPYFIPAGGFMVTPLIDVKDEDLREGLSLLTDSVLRTRQAISDRRQDQS